MNHRIDPRGQKGVSEVAFTLAHAGNFDTVTILLPKNLHATVGTNLIKMMTEQSNRMGKALTYQIEEIPK